MKKRLFQAVNCMALLLTVMNVEVACLWIFHQPEIPEEAYQLKK